MKMTAYFQLNK